MSAVVPRRAAFDDLRVGQLVAVNDEHWAWSGEVAPYGSGSSRPTPESPSQQHAFDVVDGDGDYLGTLSRNMGRSVITILRDAPAAPVTVRREDYDEAVRLADKSTRTMMSPTVVTVRVSAKWADDVKHLLRALIDNADTGD